MLQTQTGPLLTVILPLYNGAATIKTAVQSVLSQTAFQSIELLVMDGMSTDGSLEIIRTLINGHANCRLISEQDKGIYDAMNKGIEQANGQWLYFMGADDSLYDPDVIMRIFSGGINDSDLIYGNVFMATSGRKYDGYFSDIKLMHDNICHQAIFYRKQLFTLKGKYDRAYPLLADYAFNLACFGDKSVRKKYTDIIVARYSETGISNQRRDLAFKKAKNGIILKAFGLPAYFYAAIMVPLKHYLQKILPG